MRLLTPPVAAAIAVALLPAVAQARSPLCQDRPGHELASSAGDRILETREPSTTRRGDTIVRVVSCRRASRSTRVLFKAISRDDLTATAQLAAITPGKYVAVAIASATPSAGFVNINQYDLTTGKRTANIYECSIDSLWAGKSGAVAFQTSSGTVKVADADGLRTVGDTGSNDFAVGGDTMYWTDAGKVASTKLGGAPHGKFGAGTDCG